jgi:hypothetical protein
MISPLCARRSKNLKPKGGHHRKEMRVGFKTFKSFKMAPARASVYNRVSDVGAFMLD